MAGSSKKAVIAALLGNGAIAITKFGAAGYTGSAAMLSEAIHSVVDTGNQALLLFGLKRGAKPPDDKHPFGYGMEVYFWSFVVALLLFSAGAGFSIYEGINAIRHPHPITSPTVNYVVLGLAILFEAGACYVAFKEFWRGKGDRGFFAAVRAGKDPALFTVLFEDTAAIIGLIVALIGIWIGRTYGIPWVDGAAAVLIGVVLAIVAVFLAYESKGLLIGESADPEVVASIRKLVNSDERIKGVAEVLTMHMGPTDVLLNINVDFYNELDAEAIEQTVVDLEANIRGTHPDIKRIFIEASKIRSAKRQAPPA